MKIPTEFDTSMVLHSDCNKFLIESGHHPIPSDYSTMPEEQQVLKHPAPVTSKEYNQAYQIETKTPIENSHLAATQTGPCLISDASSNESYFKVCYRTFSKTLGNLAFRHTVYTHGGYTSFRHLLWTIQRNFTLWYCVHAATIDTLTYVRRTLLISP